MDITQHSDLLFEIMTIDNLYTTDEIKQHIKFIETVDKIVIICYNNFNKSIFLIKYHGNTIILLKLLINNRLLFSSSWIF